MADPIPLPSPASPTGLHFDKDYDLEDSGLNIHPHVATVTYLTGYVRGEMDGWMEHKRADSDGVCVGFSVVMHVQLPFDPLTHHTIDLPTLYLHTYIHTQTYAHTHRAAPP